MVQALLPSQEYPHGLCNTILIRGREGAEDKSVQGKSTLLFCSIHNSNIR